MTGRGFRTPAAGSRAASACGSWVTGRRSSARNWTSNAGQKAAPPSPAVLDGGIDMTTSATTAMASVLIDDDHPFMRRGLAQIINDMVETSVCDEAAGVAEALEKIRRQCPDVVVVDISLGDGNGLELTKDIKAQWPDVKV